MTLSGVHFSYGMELVALQAPPLESEDGTWNAWALPPTSTQTHQTTGGVLDFKPSKESEYRKGAGQGACNLLQQSALDVSFTPSSGATPPTDATIIPCDAVLLAEGEWSETCKRAGFTKSVDKFSQVSTRPHPLSTSTLQPHTPTTSLTFRGSLHCSWGATGDRSSHQHGPRSQRAANS